MRMPLRSTHRTGRFVWGVLITLHLSCIPSNRDFTAEFGDHDSLIQFSRDDVEIIYSPGIDIQSDQSVPPKVIRCNFDEHFIMAQQ